jgi:rhomboid protease GluP
MDLSSSLTWVALISSAFLLIQSLQARPTQRDWVVVSVLVGGGALLARWLDPTRGGYAGGALWLLLFMVPMLLIRRAQAAASRQDYASAERLFKVARWLHPTAELRLGCAQMAALGLARSGRIDEANALLQAHAGEDSALGIRARVELLRLQARWDELVVLGRAELDRQPQHQLVLGLAFLRALGECGERAELVKTFTKLAPLLAQPNAQAWRDVARLQLFAFCGRPQLVERLLAARLTTMSAANASYWLGTALVASGASAAAGEVLSPHVHTADVAVGQAIAARLAGSRLSTEPAPGEDKLIDYERVGLAHDALFAPAPPTAPRRLPVLRTITVAICAMFVVQLASGGSTAPRVLFELGALWPASVIEDGEWWRVFAFQFLHGGPVHVGFNLIGLWSLGRDVEPRLGTLRTLAVYFGAGTAGGLLMLFLTAFTERAPQLLVGASGGIMGLAGAEIALALRALAKHDSSTLKQQLGRSALLVGVQTTFDLVTPQVSALAHLSGVFTGFVLTWALRPPLGPKHGGSRETVRRA